MGSVEKRLHTPSVGDLRKGVGGCVVSPGGGGRETPRGAPLSCLRALPRLATRPAHVLARVAVGVPRRGQPRLADLRGVERPPLGGAAQSVGTAPDPLSGLLKGEHLVLADLHMCIVSGTKAIENVPCIVYIY